MPRVFKALHARQAQLGIRVSPDIKAAVLLKAMPADTLLEAVAAVVGRCLQVLGAGRKGEQQCTPNCCVAPAASASPRPLRQRGVRRKQHPQCLPDLAAPGAQAHKRTLPTYSCSQQAGGWWSLRCGMWLSSDFLAAAPGEQHEVSGFGPRAQVTSNA